MKNELDAAKDYASKMNGTCEKTLLHIINFIKFKFKNFDNSEFGNFVRERINSIEEIINKSNNRIEKAWELYQNNKETIKKLESHKIIK